MADPVRVTTRWIHWHSHADGPSSGHRLRRAHLQRELHPRPPRRSRAHNPRHRRAQHRRLPRRHPPRAPLRRSPQVEARLQDADRHARPRHAHSPGGKPLGLSHRTRHPVRLPPPPLDWPEPVTANWSTKPEDSTSDILDFTAIGNARVKSVDGQEGVVRRAQKFTATLDGREQIRALLAFFLARKGRVEAFTAPWLFRPSDVDTEAVPHATRARFADDTLTLTWLTDEAANAKISLLQVPWEINTPAGEAPVQPAEAYLYRFEADVPGVPVVWRYTDWEHDLARTENGVIVSYKGDTTGLIEHDGITQTSDLGDKATRIIMSANVPGNPLALVSANGIDVPVTIEIYRCNPANAEGAALVYSGSLTEVSEDGGKLTAETLVLGGLLRVKVPGFVFSPSCNHRFCRAGCTLDIATWTLSGLIVGQVGSELTAQITGNPNGRPLSGDFYARGVLIAGAGEGWEIRQIVRNTHLPDGKMKFVLKAPLRNAPAGLAVTFRPDCDGSISACQARQNFVNFGGHPHMGPANLSIPQRQTNTSGGKK